MVDNAVKYIFSTEKDAQTIKETMQDLIDQYEVVSIGDLKDMISERGNYKDQKSGWTSLDGATITQTREGFVLSLPAPEELF